MRGQLIAGLLLVALMGALLPAPAVEPRTVAEVLAQSKDHKVLLKAITDTGLLESLKGKDEWTVFAPTDAAFKQVNEATIKKLAGDKDAFKRFVQGHIVKGKLLSADVVKLDGKEVETLSGSKVKVAVQGKNVLLGGARVTKPDVKADNGVVHVIDAALLPGK